MNTATKSHDGYTILPTVPLGGMLVHVNDMACINHEWKQYRFPKQKSRRRVKKWAKNRNNYRMEEVHRAFEMQGKLFVSTKIFEFRIMEKELNYLSEKIQRVEHDIALCEFGLLLNVTTHEELTDLQTEKRMLENILNKLTEIELALKQGQSLPLDSLSCGRFTISKYTPFINDPISKETSIWMNTSEGEGTTINVEELFDWAM